MGYRSDMSGEISFSPPASWQELRSFARSDQCLFQFDIDEETVDTPEGELTRKTASRIVPRWESEVKAYTVAEDLNTFIDALPGRTFRGEIRIEGEESGDIRRAFIKDGVVVIWQARLLWPDGTTEDGR